VLRVLNVNKLATLLLGLATVLGATFAVGTMAAEEDNIRARIQPAGSVCVMGTECAAGLAVAAGNGEPKDPETVYNSFCAACHGTGANNAPVYGNAEAWAPRIAKGNDELLNSIVNGFNNGAMPVKGLCMDCSNDDLQATLEYMLQAVQ
jgi:cytochrome c5